jgi:flagellar basal-body rod protein FlgB
MMLGDGDDLGIGHDGTLVARTSSDILSSSEEIRRIMSAVRGLFARGAVPVLERSVAFTEMRQRLLVGNVAGFELNGFQPRDYSVSEFQGLLGEAVERRDRTHNRRFTISAGRTVREGGGGRLSLRPVPVVDNLLRHDLNNVNIERTMVELRKNVLMHERATRLLNHQYGLIGSAIRGRI